MASSLSLRSPFRYSYAHAKCSAPLPESFVKLVCFRSLGKFDTLFLYAMDRFLEVLDAVQHSHSFYSFLPSFIQPWYCGAETIVGFQTLDESGKHSSGTSNKRTQPSPLSSWHGTLFSALRPDLRIRNLCSVEISGKSSPEDTSQCFLQRASDLDLRLHLRNHVSSCPVAGKASKSIPRLPPEETSVSACSALLQLRQGPHHSFSSKTELDSVVVFRSPVARTSGTPLLQVF